MKPDEERRRNVDMAVRPAQAPEGAHGCEWVGHVFQHLFTNHEIEWPGQILGRVAHVELRKVELDPAPPRQVGPLAPLTSATSRAAGFNASKTRSASGFMTSRSH